MKILYNRQKALAHGKHEAYWTWANVKGVDLNKPFLVKRFSKDALGEFYIVYPHSDESTYTFDKEVFDIVVDEPLNLDKYL